MLLEEGIKIGIGAAASLVASSGVDILVKQTVKAAGKEALTKAQKVAVGAASLALGSVVGKEVYNTCSGRNADEDMKKACEKVKAKVRKPKVVKVDG